MTWYMFGSELNKDNLSFIISYCKRFIFNLTNNGAKDFSYSKNKELPQKFYTSNSFLYLSSHSNHDDIISP